MVMLSVLASEANSTVVLRELIDYDVALKYQFNQQLHIGAYT